MEEVKILEKFFNEQHRRCKEKVHTLYQCACGTFTVHSEYSEWLKLKSRRESPPPGSPDPPAIPSGKNKL